MSMPLPSSTKRGLVRRALCVIPTLVTFGLLIAVAYAGHHNGWKMPKYSVLTHAKTAAEPESRVLLALTGSPTDSGEATKKAGRKKFLPALGDPRGSLKEAIVAIVHQRLED